MDPLDFLIRDNVDRHRKYPQLTSKLKASVIPFVKKESEGGGGGDTGEATTEDIVEIPESEINNILRDMTQGTIHI